MYAIIVSGGRQYRVTEQQTLKLEKLAAEVGSTIDFDQILLLADGENVQVGLPYVAGAKVTASVIAQSRHKKIQIVKFRRRKHHQKVTGHRQYFTEVKIEKIEV